MLFFLWISAEYTLKSWVTWERTMDTALMAHLAPARTAMPLGALFLLLLQGIAELLRCRYDMDDLARKWLNLLLPVYVAVLAAICTETFFPEIFPLGDLFEGGLKGAFGLQPTMIGVIMIAVMLLAIFVGFPISFTLIFWPLPSGPGASAARWCSICRPGSSTL